MFELPLIFVSGILGSSHCLGMCGPFAAILGSASNGWRQNVGWQIAYSFGRIFTYAVLGAMAGFGGQRLLGLKWFGVNLTSLLAIAAGAILLREGLVTAGLLRRRAVVARHSGCASGGLLRAMLQQRNHTGIFLAGITTGFLPCGLVYAFLLIAARTSNLFLGSAVMIAFGLGTLPMMVVTGTTASAIPMAWRARLFKLAGWFVVAMGMLSLYRGWAFLMVDDPSACPFCG
jgi:sulfite exporter TauE/SafE